MYQSNSKLQLGVTGISPSGTFSKKIEPVFFAISHCENCRIIFVTNETTVKRVLAIGTID